ncbi:MAG: hypothetical protein ABIK21_00500 [bacterium]
MYFDYLKIKIGKHNGLLFFTFIVIALIVIIRVIAPLYNESGISIELFFVVIICIGIFLPIFCVLNRYLTKQYDLAKTLSKRIFSEYKQPFQRKWCCEVIVIDLVAQIHVPLSIGPLSIDWSTSEKVLCHFLPFIFTGDNQNNKAENAFLNLLTLLELNKALIWNDLIKSQIDMSSESSNSFRFAMAFIEQAEPHRKILSNIGYILVLMRAIAYLNGGNFESFDEDQLEEFFDEWDSTTWSTWSLEPRMNSLPKSLNNREFTMENYSDEGFKELVFTFAEYCDSPFFKKDKVSIVGRRLIEKRGNIIPPEDDEAEEDE